MPYAIPFLTSGLWLISTPGGLAKVVSSMTRAMVFAEDNPSDTFVLSSMGLLAMDAGAR